MKLTSISIIVDIRVEIGDIDRREWEDVLDHFYNKNIISVSEHVLEKILTQVALEMIELRDTEVAKAILRETETMQRCKNKNNETVRGVGRCQSSAERLDVVVRRQKDPRRWKKTTIATT